MTPDSPEERGRGDQGDWRPRPDPTILTTEALHREVAALRELIEERITATDLLVSEKFSSVDRQLDLVERQRVEQKSDTKAAVDAALTAQKEAVREQTLASEKAIQKSETSTTKQLEQITITFSTALTGLNAQLDDIKARVVTIEAIKVGGQEKVLDQRQTVSNAGAVIGILVGLVSLIGILAAAGVFSRGAP